MKTHDTIKCIVCSKELENMSYETREGKLVEVHPMGGLHFRSYGHYGSAIFDPMGTGEYLDIAICDQCVTANLDRVRGIGKQNLEEDAASILADAEK